MIKTVERRSPHRKAFRFWTVERVPSRTKVQRKSCPLIPLYCWDLPCEGMTLENLEGNKTSGRDK